ncbi:hypothetical protein [Streptomyces antimicrobicus]|uniref:Uncharacterized protein n=1 Tax=Streptomyces antimicrobicus TaxID=2883108 RepID=A0ABS8B6H6_9ACTN|nr:hypothetical protein [Streptomyces antimicrobicus]MCB5180159.1 hypothetical protein [Streptomyces antimicrobicus]
MTGRHEERAHGAAAARAGREIAHCPACGRPVETVIRRSKHLGIFVPEWVPGPCKNPDCPAYDRPEP